VTIEGRHGHPGTLLSVGHSEGKYLYVEAKTHPVSCIAALDREDVEQLVAACSEWLQLDAARELEQGPSNVVSLVSGAIDRGRIDAATVQFRTV
jgi:hypothetical protein